MDTDIEGKIRDRIEAILVNDARNHAEVKMATVDDPLEIGVRAYGRRHVVPGAENA